MAKNSKPVRRKKKPSDGYTRAKYLKDIESGIHAYVDGVRMINYTSRMIRTVLDAVTKSENLSEDNRNQFTENLDILTANVETTTTKFEELKPKVETEIPTHKTGSRQEVADWAAHIRLTVMEATEWTIDVGPIYQEIIEHLQSIEDTSVVLTPSGDIEGEIITDVTENTAHE